MNFEGFCSRATNGYIDRTRVGVFCTYAFSSRVFRRIKASSGARFVMWETHFQDMWADPMENDLFRSGIPPTRKPTTILQTGGLSKWVTCSIDFPYFPHLFTAKKKSVLWKEIHTLVIPCWLTNSQDPMLGFVLERKGWSGGVKLVKLANSFGFRLLGLVGLVS